MKNLMNKLTRPGLSGAEGATVGVSLLGCYVTTGFLSYAFGSMASFVLFNHIWKALKLPPWVRKVMFVLSFLGAGGLVAGMQGCGAPRAVAVKTESSPYVMTLVDKIYHPPAEDFRPVMELKREQADEKEEREYQETISRWNTKTPNILSLARFEAHQKRVVNLKQEQAPRCVATCVGCHNPANPSKHTWVSYVSERYCQQDIDPIMDVEGWVQYKTTLYPKDWPAPNDANSVRFVLDDPKPKVTISKDPVYEKAFANTVVAESNNHD